MHSVYFTALAIAGQGEPESNGNEGVLHSIQISRIGASPSNLI